MSEIKITNCHIHTFTAKHVPRCYPHPALSPWRKIPGVLWLLAVICRFVGQLRWAEMLDRLVRFQDEGDNWSQIKIMDGIIPQYPEGTRFVVLPMDMAPSGHGAVQHDIAAQHKELATVAADAAYRELVIPFAGVHPDHPGAAEEVRRCLDDLGFRGLKIYPRLGYPPDHPVLMERVYPMLAERNLPVMTHCSRGGMTARGLTRATADRYCAPEAYIPVMRAFPKLRICLAHFGGQADWRAYVEDGIDPRDPDARKRNWQVQIRDLIEGMEYPNLWTDISYTLFHFEDYIPFLRIFLQNTQLAKRVLFGSDYYMTRQEELSERAVCFRLRDALGEERFRQIAEVNPRIWLGEAAERPGAMTLDRLLPIR